VLEANKKQSSQHFAIWTEAIEVWPTASKDFGLATAAYVHLANMAVMRHHLIFSAVIWIAKSGVVVTYPCGSAERHPINFSASDVLLLLVLVKSLPLTNILPKFTDNHERAAIAPRLAALRTCRNWQ